MIAEIENASEHLASNNDADANWQVQIRDAIRDVETLNARLAEFTHHRIGLSETAEHVAKTLFEFKVTPFMVSALRRALEQRIPGAWDAFAAAFIPSDYEADRGADQQPTADSIGEDLRTAHPAPAISRFYRNRALLRVSHMCPAYCRYCFRRRLVGDDHGGWDAKNVGESLDFIASDTSVREVILSGGEPLLLSDTRLQFVFERLAGIDHVRRVRIDTKALTMIPQRVTRSLARLLRNAGVNAIVGHFSHAYEIAPEVETAIGRLIDAGVPVLAHVPLLRHVNDDERVLVELLERLVDLRIRPYYLIHFIPTGWTEHFRVSIARGLELMNYVQRQCTGMAVPAYIVYLPGGHGKVQVAPSHLVRTTSEGYVFRAHDGADVLYREPLHVGPGPNSSEA